MRRYIFLMALALSVTVINSSNASSSNSSQFESPDGYTITYPNNWSIAPQRFQNAVELVGVSDSLDKTTNVARIVITTETRLSHTGALQRLKEIDAEQNEVGTFLNVGGWPAIQKRYTAVIARPGSPKQSSDETELRVSTAIAADVLLVRIEGVVQPGADAALANEIEIISKNVVFKQSGDSVEIKIEINNLQTSPRLITPADPSPQETSSPGFTDEADNDPAIVTTGVNWGTEGLVQRIQTVNVDSEIEIAVSNDGQNVVVGNNGRDFATSNDGGQTFTTTGLAPPQPGASANGDPSLTFGASGNFYFGFIGFPAAGQCSTGIDVSTNNGQSFNFVANATICDNNQGTGSVGPSCFPDQEHIAADRFNPSTVNANQDQVYSVWRNFSGGGCGPRGSATAIAGPEIPTLVCSNDSAANWSASVIVGTGAYSRITVAPDGFVYVAYRSGNNLMLNKFSSCDNGMNQQAGFPVTVATVVRLVCPVPGIDRCNTGSDFTSQMVAVDDTNANHIYYSYGVSTNATVNENIIVRDSTDGGLTWPNARTVQVNNNVNGRRFMPWICATNGTAYTTWYDMRAATAGQNDLADFYGASAFLDGGGNLQAGAEFRISTVSDPMCASGWPAAPRGQGDSESCFNQPQLAGNCTNTTGNTTGARCDFSDCGGAGSGAGASCQCNIAANETCNLGGGIPKYGDYNGNACANGQLFAAWASATSPPGIVPASTNIDVFFETPLNDPPFASAGPDQVLECIAAGTSTNLDGTGSSDPDGNSITFSWQNNFVEGGGTVTGITPAVTFTSLGSEVVSLTVQDSVGYTDTDTVTITVNDTIAPILTVPADATAECAAPGGTTVNIGTATATDGCDTSVTITNDAPAVFPLGSTTVTWTAVDDSGNSTVDTQTVLVEDTIPPELSMSLAPRTLWSPDHKLRTINATIVVTDICDANPVVRVTSVTSNEPDNGKGDGNTVNDIQGVTLGTDDRVFELRAERASPGSGRVYTAIYEAEDSSSNTTTKQDTVNVPHSN